MIAVARAHGMMVMVGCMIESSHRDHRGRPLHAAGGHRGPRRRRAARRRSVRRRHHRRRPGHAARRARASASGGDDGALRHRRPPAPARLLVHLPHSRDAGRPGRPGGPRRRARAAARADRHRASRPTRPRPRPRPATSSARPTIEPAVPDGLLGHGAVDGGVLRRAARPHPQEHVARRHVGRVPGRRDPRPPAGGRSEASPARCSPGSSERGGEAPCLYRRAGAQASGVGRRWTDSCGSAPVSLRVEPPDTAGGTADRARGGPDGEPPTLLERDTLFKRRAQAARALRGARGAGWERAGAARGRSSSASAMP